MFKTKKFVAVVAMCTVALLAFSACGGGKKEASASGESAGGSASASAKKASSGKAPKANPASDFEYDFNEDGKSLYIKKFIGTGSTVVFPAEIEGFPVTRIYRKENLTITSEIFEKNGDSKVFTGKSGPWKVNTSVKSVVIPEGVEFISRGAFAYCEGLESVTLPNTLKEIGDFAFSGTAIKKIVIPDSIEKLWTEKEYRYRGEKTLRYEGEGIFAGCKNLKEVVLPDSLTILPESMFYECTSLTDVNIPAGIKKICTHVFRDCPLTNLKIPESIEAIEFIFWDTSDRYIPQENYFPAFQGSQPPLAMRKRLQDLGYEGSF